uniref:Uncharacterized protein n=1 Tax=Myoviridae sp. ctIyl4 TaxID=2825078 RepID=A0A8S5PN58_9CAUD|nr:MAG TPA: hypothetical protein [Myoviridae sp. ctIyl4]
MAETRTGSCAAKLAQPHHQRGRRAGRRRRPIRRPQHHADYAVHPFGQHRQLGGQRHGGAYA